MYLFSQLPILSTKPEQKFYQTRNLVSRNIKNRQDKYVKHLLSNIDGNTQTTCVTV